MAGESRGLTEGEKAMLKRGFGIRIDYDSIRLCRGHRYHPAAFVALRMPRTDAVTIGYTIYFDRLYHTDFAACRDREAQVLLFHEMTHVYQWVLLGRVGFLSRYLKEFLSVGRKQSAMYHYRGADDARGAEHFHEARLEAQADMIRDYARALLDEDAAGMAKQAVHLQRTHFFSL